MLTAALESLSSRVVYRRNEVNLRYDGNLRAAIGLSSGRYCFLLGNDDALATPDVLGQLADHLRRIGPAGVVVTNYADFATGQAYRRATRTGVVGAGPAVAAANFRNLSFVSGILLDGRLARGLFTERWDHSEMYQMYIGSRIVALGENLISIDLTTIRKDIQLPGLRVNSYATRPKARESRVVERRMNLDKIPHLVIDAIQPFASPTEAAALNQKIIWQVWFFTYAFWLFEYRKVQSWKYSAGIALGVRPRYIMRGVPLTPWGRLALLCIYVLVTLAGLLLPTSLFSKFQRPLHAVAKRCW